MIPPRRSLQGLQVKSAHLHRRQNPERFDGEFLARQADDQESFPSPPQRRRKIS
jgi:hypothetical protein